MKKLGLCPSKICERLSRYGIDSNLQGFVFMFQSRYVVKGSDIGDMVESKDERRLISFQHREYYNDLAAVLFDLSLSGWNISSLKKEDNFVKVIFQTYNVFHDSYPNDVFQDHGVWKQIMTTNITAEVVENFMSFFV